MTLMSNSLLEVGPANALAVLVVPSGLNLGLVHHGEVSLPPVDLAEDHIHLLQGPARSLGVEEVDHRNDEGVDDGEDDVSLVLDVVERNGRDHDNHEVEDPVRRRGQRVGGRTNAERDDLGRVKPGHAEPADGKDSVEDEEEHDAGDLIRLVFRAGVDACQDGHGGCLADGTE